MSIVVTEALLARFWAKVRITPGCWVWLASGTRGYGVIGAEGRTHLAHRVSWQIHNGTPPASLWVLHRCDNPACVNPDHLFLGTHDENMRDMAEKGRGRGNHPIGTQAYHAKLTADQAREVRRLRSAGVPQRAVASRFGVHRSTVQDITTGRTYVDA